ncbi:MAG: hypothetical protein WB626_04660 [Bacteroidota bacterium]
MFLNEDGHATMELLMLLPLIVLLLALITLTGDLYYFESRTILASKCLVLDDYGRYYEHLGLRGESEAASAYSYEGEEVLRRIFFGERESGFQVEAPHRREAEPQEGDRQHTPGTPPPDLDGGMWQEMVGVINGARGKTWAVASVEFRPAFFWPEAHGTLTDSVYLAASDWRYAEMPGGYVGLIRRRVTRFFEELGL